MTRDAASIGEGLAPARTPRAIRSGERIHVLGVAGAGASAAAWLAARAGGRVSGCDPGGPSPYTVALEATGVAMAWEHDAEHVSTDSGQGPERLAVTKALTAIDPDHPELAAARAAGIPIEPWQQVVADAATGRRLVAIAGTHGKSTTSGWLVDLLVRAGEDPSAFVGALLPERVTGGPPGTARWGMGDAFVVEADEYAGNFDPYRADVAVLTGAEWDHPDVFPNRAAVVEAFADWIEHGPPDGRLVVNVGDAGGRAVVEALATPRTIVAYRLDDDGAVDPDTTRPADVVGRIVALQPDATDLEIDGLAEGETAHRVRLRTAGRHNAANALAVAGAARVLGISPAAIVAGLEGFTGVGRRLERKGDARGVTVYDDYGHHPTAIRETIAAVRQREPGRRLWAVYEPLTYHRTAALLDAFADALSTADIVAIADIWAGRDPDTTIASASGLAEAVRATHPGIVATAPGSVEATAAYLADAVRDGDAVLVMGGGRSYRIGELLLERRQDHTGDDDEPGSRRGS